jgi:HSP20 family protein
MAGDDDDRKEFWSRRNPFYGLFDEFDKMDEMMDDMMKSVFQDFEGMKGSNKPLSYGFSMRMGADGKPQIQEFGNMRPTEEKIEIKDEREPLVDVIDRHEEIDVLAELPGVEKKDIDIHATESQLTISVPGKFQKRIPLKEKVRADSVKAQYKNGVLTVTLAKKEPSKESGKKVKVE